MPSCLSSQRWFIYLSQSGMGDFVTFVGAGNILLEYAIDRATISRSWTSYFAIMYTSNYSDFMPYGVRGIFTSAAVLYFAYVGFDVVATMAEETKNPAKDIPIGLVGSMVVIITFYCLMALTLCLMQNYKTLDDEAGYNVAFSKVGMDWAKYIVALGALEGMTTVLMGVRLPISEWNWETLWHS